MASESDLPIPETRVLAIASHVVYGYVGNTLAALVMQVLGCDVAALNTVHFSNHTGYRNWKGTKATGAEIRNIYQGLKENYLNDFDMLLSGYAPSAEAVSAIGSIGRDLKLKASTKPGSLFWVLDPVMGDEGKLFVSDEVIPAYKTLLRDADLILPNQFELEVLTGIQITSEAELIKAITVAHKEYLVPHVIVTSVSFDPKSPHISVIGSSRRSGGTPRLFKVNVPSIDCYFTGPGDMFAALTVVRLREAVLAMGLENTTCWMPADDVEGPDLPIAKSTEKVLASMHVVLSKTKKARDEALESMGGPMGVLEKEKDSEKRTLLRKMKAAEVRLVRNFRDLLEPNVVYKAELLEI